MPPRESRSSRKLQPYPFEKLRALIAGIDAAGDASRRSACRSASRSTRRRRSSRRRCAASARRPGHLSGHRRHAGAARRRSPRWLRAATAAGARPGDAVLPVNGSREALFAFAQTVIDPTRAARVVVCPNPFYQIYEGAALLAGAEPSMSTAPRATSRRLRRVPETSGGARSCVRLLAGQPDRRA